MSKSTSWHLRVAMTQPLIFSPIFAATSFVEENGIIRFLLLGIVITSWLWLNQIFIKDLAAIFKSVGASGKMLKEYCWVFFMGCMNITFFALFYFMFGVQNGESIIVGDFYLSFYFSIVTWTTLGYGDFAPIENLRFVAAFEAMMGYLYMAILVGLLLNIAQQYKEQHSASEC